jgi:hypothetical protein
VSSPVSVLFYDEYHSPDEIKNYIDLNSDKLQCIVSNKDSFSGSTNFGETQFPGITDFADNIDTIKFLLDIN